MIYEQSPCVFFSLCHVEFFQQQYSSKISAMLYQMPSSEALTNQQDKINNINTNNQLTINVKFLNSYYLLHSLIILCISFTASPKYLYRQKQSIKMILGINKHTVPLTINVEIPNSPTIRQHLNVSKDAKYITIKYMKLSKIHLPAFSIPKQRLKIINP